MKRVHTLHYYLGLPFRRLGLTTSLPQPPGQRVASLIVPTERLSGH
jgi:hypothetical protein